MGRLQAKGAVVPLVIALTLAGTASAGAATLTLSTAGEHPAIAVDDSGTGHIAWTESVPAGDDRLVYCRLPRGASACAQTQAFTLPAEGGEPEVLLGEGEVILVTRHCCTLASARGEIWALRSGDGGTTFSAPVMIGDTDTFHGGFAYGPGTGQVSAVGAPTEGVLYQAEPLTGPAVPYTQRALLLEGVAPASASSVAMLDPLTPAVSYSDFDGQSFARIYDGSGSYNDAANWLPPTPALAGDESGLAGGLRGLYMVRRTGEPAARKYVVDRYDQTTGAFGSTKRVSPAGDPIFRDFIEDAGGNLHAVWVQNDEEKEPLYLRQSSDGQTWQELQRLAKTSDDAYNLRAGAGSDGGGWAVWNTESGGGAVRAAPFAPIGPGGGGAACVPGVNVGKVAAIATEGCFKKHGDEYTTAGALRINGLDLTPGASARPGARAHRRAGSTVTIDKGKATLVSAGKVLVKAGNVALDKAKLSWKLPQGGGQLKDLAGNPAVFDAAKANVEFLALPVSGWVSPSFTGGASTELPVNLELPEPVGSLLASKITGQTTLRLNNASGLVLSGAELRADSIYLGIAEVKDLLLRYVGDPFLLEGSAVVLLPVVKSKLDPVQVGFADGGFDYGTANLVFDDPGRPVSNFAYLRSINAAVSTDPTKISGGVVATGGPTLTLGGTKYAAVTANGTVSYTFTDPGVFLAEGTGSIFNVPATHVSTEFVTSGKLTIAGDFSIPAPPLRLSGSVEGGVSLTSGAFNLLGTGEGCGMAPIPGCIAGIKVLVSSKAAAGCVSSIPITVDPGPPPSIEKLSAGVAYVWSSGFKVFAGCDLGPYQVSLGAKATDAAVAAGTSLPITIPKGSRQVNLAIHGSGAPPLVTITGPGSETVSSAANPSGSATGSAGLLTQSDEDDTAYAALPRPAGGQWSIDPVPGSAAIVGVEQARALPDPKIKARVVGKGRHRTLRYEIKRIEGQVVRFFERGRFGTKSIGLAKGKRGSLRFAAADGPGGKRAIEAAVQSFGIPRDVLTVARYRAPNPVKPAKPRGLRVRRRGSRALVSWDRARGARGYIVEVALADGRRLAISTKRTRATIKYVPGIDSARISVAGLEADNSHGKVAHARLRAKPKKRRRDR